MIPSKVDIALAAVPVKGDREGAMGLLEEIYWDIGKVHPICEVTERSKENAETVWLRGEIRLSLQADYNELCQRVEADFDINADDLCGTCKTYAGGRARNIVMFVLRHRHGMSFPAIGKLFDIHHATVMAAFHKFNTNGLDKTFYKIGDLGVVYEDAKERLMKGVKDGCRRKNRVVEGVGNGCSCREGATKKEREREVAESRQ